MMFILTGCGIQSTKVKPQSVFSSFFTATYSEQQIKGVLGVDNKGIITIKVTKPEELKNFTATFKNNKLEVNYSGISINVNPKELGNNAFFPVILSTLKNSLTKDLNFKPNKNGYEATEKTKYGNFKITVNNDMKITSVKLLEKGFKLELY